MFNCKFLIFFRISFFTNALYCLNLSKTSPLAFKMYTFVDESYEVSHFIMHDVVFISSHTLCAQSLKVLKLIVLKRCYLIFFANALFTHILRKFYLVFLPMHYVHMSWDLSLQHLCCFVHLQYYPVFFGIRIFYVVKFLIFIWLK